MSNFNELIKHHFYINLNERTDRRNLCEEELKKWDLKPNRFPAIKISTNTKVENRSGIIGCGMSHLKCIETAKENGWDYVAIFEDDIVIPKPTQVKNTVNRILESGEAWDIMLLSGNVLQPHKRIEEDFIVVNRSYTTTAYIVKNSFYDTLIQNLKEGVEGLIRTKERSYSLDAYWWKLMTHHIFLLPLPLTIYQRPDFSNIENTFVDYKKSILNINK
tara:strand:+ start:198 stop:851 length:654 start_codon:yes stop_codon:yes gene_type:complete